MSTVYKLNKRYKVTIELDVLLNEIQDHFPNLEELVFDLVENPEVIKELLYDLFINKLETEYNEASTVFDNVNLDIKNSKIIKISNEY